MDTVDLGKVSVNCLQRSVMRKFDVQAATVTVITSKLELNIIERINFVFLKVHIAGENFEIIVRADLAGRSVDGDLSVQLPALDFAWIAAFQLESSFELQNRFLAAAEHDRYGFFFVGIIWTFFLDRVVADHHRERKDLHATIVVRLVVLKQNGSLAGFEDFARREFPGVGGKEVCELLFAIDSIAAADANWRSAFGNVCVGFDFRNHKSRVHKI